MSLFIVTQRFLLCISGVITAGAGYVSIPADCGTGGSLGFVSHFIVAQRCNRQMRDCATISTDDLIGAALRTGGLSHHDDIAPAVILHIALGRTTVGADLGRATGSFDPVVAGGFRFILLGVITTGTDMRLIAGLRTSGDLALAAFHIVAQGRNLFVSGDPLVTILTVCAGSVTYRKASCILLLMLSLVHVVVRINRNCQVGNHGLASFIAEVLVAVRARPVFDLSLCHTSCSHLFVMHLVLMADGGNDPRVLLYFLSSRSVAVVLTATRAAVVLAVASLSTSGRFLLSLY